MKILVAPATKLIEEEFDSIVSELADTSHGSDGLVKLRGFFKNCFGKTVARTCFLESRLVRPPIIWSEIKERAWGSHQERDSNQFHFLQGDVVNSTRVQDLDGLQLEHDLWMVLSTDCDCIRADYVRVGRVVQVDISRSEYKHAHSMAFKFANEKGFPLPKLPDESQASSYVVNLEVPAYLCFGDGYNQDRSLVTQRASLTDSAWHILNALLLHQGTRANLDEALRIRNIA